MVPATRCERCVLLQAEQPVAPGQARAVEVPRAPTWAELSVLLAACVLEGARGESMAPANRACTEQVPSDASV